MDSLYRSSEEKSMISDKRNSFFAVISATLEKTDARRISHETGKNHD